jgi:hypothetical protein
MRNGTFSEHTLLVKNQATEKSEAEHQAKYI